MSNLSSNLTRIKNATDKIRTATNKTTASIEDVANMFNNLFIVSSSDELNSLTPIQEDYAVTRPQAGTREGVPWINPWVPITTHDYNSMSSVLHFKDRFTLDNFYEEYANIVFWNEDSGTYYEHELGTYEATYDSITYYITLDFYDPLKMNEANPTSNAHKVFVQYVSDDGIDFVLNTISKTDSSGNPISIEDNTIYLTYPICFSNDSAGSAQLLSKFLLTVQPKDWTESTWSNLVYFPYNVTLPNKLDPGYDYSVNFILDKPVVPGYSTELNVTLGEDSGSWYAIFYIDDVVIELNNKTYTFRCDVEYTSSDGLNFERTDLFCFLYQNKGSASPTYYDFELMDSNNAVLTLPVALKFDFEHETSTMEPDPHYILNFIKSASLTDAVPAKLYKYNGTSWTEVD